MCMRVRVCVRERDRESGESERELVYLFMYASISKTFNWLYNIIIVRRTGRIEAASENVSYDILTGALHSDLKSHRDNFACQPSGLDRRRYFSVTGVGVIN